MGKKVAKGASDLVETVCATFRTPDGVEYTVRACSAEAAAEAVRVLQAGAKGDKGGGDADGAAPQPTELKT